MKKLTTGKRQMILRKLTKIAVLFVFAGITAGCEIFEYSDPFPDSYYSDNFIQDVGFDLFSGYDTALPAPDPETGAQVPVTGSWDFAYRYTDWDQFNYMRFDRANPTAVASDFSSVPEGLAADAPVYRLEVVNLVSGGHFEFGQTGTWAGSGTAVHDSYYRITGTGSMRLDAESARDILFTPATLAGFSSRAAVAYAVFFRFSSGDPFVVNAGSDDLALDPDSEPGLASGLFSPEADGDTVRFQFEPESVGLSFSALYVDDFTMAKSGGMALRLRLRPSETTHRLEPGTWEFRVWVHADPSADADGSAGPYPLDSLSVNMGPVGESTLAADSNIYSAAESTGWTRVSAILSSQALQYPRDYGEADEPVLDLIISCEDVNPGSILLAAPELRFR
jgi:hypothetical protein